MCCPLGHNGCGIYSIFVTYILDEIHMKKTGSCLRIRIGYQDMVHDRTDFNHPGIPISPHKIENLHCYMQGTDQSQTDCIQNSISWITSTPLCTIFCKRSQSLCNSILKLFFLFHIGTSPSELSPKKHLQTNLFNSVY